MKMPRGTSESSTTSDNTAEFIDIVRKYDVVYNTHNQDYKNVEVKMKVWDQIADEIGLTVDASRRKWKNLRDSYTKYLRSFRTGTKTSKKYQYWAHADHMEFLKPYQGPGRKCGGILKTNDEEDTECDLGYQVLTKATTSAGDYPRMAIATNTAVVATGMAATTTATSLPSAVCTATSITTADVAMIMPSLPSVQLPPPAIGTTPTQPITVPTPNSGTPKSVSASNVASSVGCLIIDAPKPSATCIDPFNKDLSDGQAMSMHNAAKPQVSSTTAGISSQAVSVRVGGVAAKSRRLHAPIVLTHNASHSIPTKTRKTTATAATLSTAAAATPLVDGDVSLIMQAARELDANTLFFLSLARTVRSMPAKYQSLSKMRCMRIVSDIELELDNVSDDTAPAVDSSTPPPPASGVAKSDVDTGVACHSIASSTATDAATEHFVYVMSPSRVESMIDISSDEESTPQDGN